MFQEFSSKSSIHGLRYISGKRRPFDKIFWACALIISFSCCLYLISNIWMHWNKHPLSVNKFGKILQLQDIQSPAITVCPLNKLRNSSLYSTLDEADGKNCTLSLEE